MPLDLMKRVGGYLGDGFKKCLEAFAYLGLAAFVIVLTYFGIDAAVYIFNAGIDALETILALIPA